MVDSPLSDLPLGDVRLFDDYQPSLDPGTWRIEVGHTLSGVATGRLGASQEFVVSAPQFAVDPGAVLNRYPPEGSTGNYAEALPHIALNDALLPWERPMSGSRTRPWVALLILRDDELTGATGSPTRLTTSTVAAFLAPEQDVLKPVVTKELDVADDDPCGFIQLPAALFAKLTPRLGELPFLAHCRQSNIADKADQGLDRTGLFSVVLGNRFPVPGTDGPRKYIAHLVSLEGLEAVLVDRPDFGSHTSVALLSLASWTFTTEPEQQQHFRGLMNQIVGQEYDGMTYRPDNLWLRLPAPDVPIDTGDAAGAEAEQRILDGFVPMRYHVRTGENSFAWYRGPLTPVLTTPLNPPGPFLTADSALIYQSEFGVIDASLATAWEAGRALALADRGFGQALFAFRRRGHSLTDALLERLHSDAFSATRIADLRLDTSVQDEFLRILSADLLADLGAPPALPTTSAPRTVTTPTAPDPDPKTAVRDFLANPVAHQQIVEGVQEELTAVAGWLAKLLLLYPVPFTLLVPDARMLANETLRFFYVDQNWLRCLVDGALSIGMESSRDTLFHQTTHELIHAAALTATRELREQRIGVAPPVTADGDTVISGFLLRSGVVSGWPNLAVRGGMNDGTPLKTLRMDHLAPNLLFCLFGGVPDFVELSEPQEGLRFGVDEDGLIPLRQPVSGGAVTLGTQLTSTFQVLPTCLRPTGGAVLDLSPASPTGAVQRIQAALAAAGAAIPGFGPADFGLQLLKTPEAIRFSTQSG
jgi:hypothetical protein